MLNKNDIFPIAIGTYGLGAERFESTQEFNQTAQKPNDLKALLQSFELGQNYIETSFIYAGGQTINFLKDFFKLVPRDRLFITVKLESTINEPTDIENQIDKYLKIMGLDFADSILLHTPFVTSMPLDETYKEMLNLIKKGKSRFISASNLSIRQLKYTIEDVGIKPFSFEGLYNLDNKTNEDNGIIDYCKQHNILFVGYQPLRRNRIADNQNQLLLSLCNKYNKTQNQILLNWLVKEKSITPIVKTSDLNHIKQNIDALDFDISKSDLNTLNDFRNKEFDSIEIDWENKGGIPIYKLPNQK